MIRAGRGAGRIGRGVIDVVVTVTVCVSKVVRSRADMSLALSEADDNQFLRSKHDTPKNSLALAHMSGSV
eukprot:937006-Amorphochlora_amoeboformis.AAC.2